MKILVCFGTRPEAIKMAPVIYELKKQNLDFKVCITAQHREMLDQVLEFFGIIANYDLDLMRPDQSLNLLSSHILKEIDRVLEDYKPDIVLVQGDTTTAFITALAAFYKEIKIGHIEAGLRTLNLRSPYPEEANRQLISRITDIHFVPTFSAKQNLLKEGIKNENIHITGNTVIDSLEVGKSRLEKGYINKEIRNLESLLHNNKKMVLVTGHRRENFGIGLSQVCQALLTLASRKDLQIIFPVHLNPRVKLAVTKVLRNHPNINLTPPANYPAFIWLMQKADIIISDSGGIQEEAPSLKKPVLITRDTTERIEGVDSGFSFLTGTSTEAIISTAIRLMDFPPDYINKKNPFGDGKAAERIMQILKTNNA